MSVLRRKKETVRKGIRNCINCTVENYCEDQLKKDEMFEIRCMHLEAKQTYTVLISKSEEKKQFRN
jgi:hypothetical protein